MENNTYTYVPITKEILEGLEGGELYHVKDKHGVIGTERGRFIRYDK